MGKVKEMFKPGEGVEDLRVAVDRLSERHGRVQRAVQTNEAERRRHAIAAESGDENARAALDRANVEAQELAVDLSNAELALDEARQRLAAAEAEAARAARARKVRAYEQLKAQRLNVVADIEDALRRLGDGMARLRDLDDKVRARHLALGGRPPRPHPLDTERVTGRILDFGAGLGLADLGFERHPTRPPAVSLVGVEKAAHAELTVPEDTSAPAAGDGDDDAGGDPPAAA